MSASQRPAAVRHPDITVRLTGQDGNAYMIIGLVTRALRRAGHGDEVEVFLAEAKAGDYDHLLQTVMRWVDTV